MWGGATGVNLPRVRHSQALAELGYKLEDLYEEETDAALGNGGM